MSRCWRGRAACTSALQAWSTAATWVLPGRCPILPKTSSAQETMLNSTHPATFCSFWLIKPNKNPSTEQFKCWLFCRCGGLTTTLYLLWKNLQQSQISFQVPESFNTPWRHAYSLQMTLYQPFLFTLFWLLLAACGILAPPTRNRAPCPLCTHTESGLNHCTARKSVLIIS